MEEGEAALLGSTSSFAPPVRPAFLTQALALASKNTTYQRKNLYALCPAECLAQGEAQADVLGGRARSCLRRPSHAFRASLLSRTNCCLVLTPLVFSVVLGGEPRAAARRPPQVHLCSLSTPRGAVISYLLNNLVFSADTFKCGCQCQAYSVGDVVYERNSTVRAPRQRLLLRSAHAQ
jgi:hypothetical protein